MDPIRNPYAPGAGTPPPELAGRAEVQEAAAIALGRLRIGRPSKSIILVGLRGVGKTVLLDQIRLDAEDAGATAVSIEAPEGRSLPSLLVPALRASLLALSRKESAKHVAAQALGALANFAQAWNVTVSGVTLNLDFTSEPGIADNGDLDLDLQQLLELVGRAAAAGDTCIALFVDELQYVKEAELAALITALHRSAQRMLPVVLVGAGLPQTRGQLGLAKSYAERLFDFEEIDSLNVGDACRALAKPAREEGVEFDPAALNQIVEQTQGYPYFLQVWGKHVWNVADDSPITISDVERGGARAQHDLDSGFFQVRFDRLTPAELQYVRAMAELGSGPHRSSDVASALGRAITSLSPVRQSLIDKGMIWSPGHGEIAFTVPLFDQFMKRAMPTFEQ
jgi:hypothetical protein